MKRLLMISYDLNKAASEEYKALSEYLEGLADSGWMKPLESVYLIQTAKSVREVHEGIKQVLTTEEHGLRNDTRWMVIAVKLSDGIGWLDKRNVDWWSTARANGL